MGLVIIQVGDGPNDGQGDSLRAAMTKVNEMMAELYDAKQAQGQLINTLQNALQALEVRIAALENA